MEGEDGRRDHQYLQLESRSCDSKECRGWHSQTQPTMDIATYILNHLKGRFSENTTLLVIKKLVLVVHFGFGLVWP